MKIINCRTNHMTAPVGFAMDRAVCTWVTESDISQVQTRAQIRVALDENMEDILYTSDPADSVESTGFSLPITLKPRTRYYWTVQVWGDGGDTAVSHVNYFETGKREEPLLGDWITTPWEDRKINPYIRKSFRLPAGVRKARLYMIGLGLYLPEVNGKAVGDGYLAPGCTAVDRWNQIYTYDVTDQLHRGDNVLGVMMGDGWAKGRFGNAKYLTAADGTRVYVDTYLVPPEVRAAVTYTESYIDRFYLKAELRVELEDGSKLVIVTDNTWKCAPSPVLESGIYEGEVYDANKAIPGWSTADCADAGWDAMEVTEDVPIGQLEDRLSLAICCKETIQPVALIHTPAGETVLDLGQNIAGWVRLRIHEPAGATIRLQHGEILQNGCFYRDNLRKAKAEYVYISDGKAAEVEPHFTFYGFRYVKIEGIENPKLEDFTGCVVYSDLEETGWFETSDNRINRLFENAKWSQKDNFLDVPTDCPQRNERMGWTGDAHVFCKTGSYNMETYAFYTKYLHDLWREQEKNHGMVSHVVPSVIRQSFCKSGFWQGGACVWGDAATGMPWTLYEHYGDKTILERQYESMKAWVDWITGTVVSENGLWDQGFQFGDWLALDGNRADDRYGGTDDAYIASVYLKYSAQLTAKAAEVLGFVEDAARYTEISRRTKKALQENYFEANGRCKIRTQTAQILALVMEIVEGDHRKQVARDLLDLLREKGMHLQTGFVGTPFLCKALSMEGCSEAAYQVLFQEDFPSWLYEVNMGATTIWERWNSVLPDGSMSGTGMNSLNHYAYGSIAQWMYENIAGLTVVEPGFKTFRVRPEFTDRFSFVHAKYDSAMGTIEIRWETLEDGSHGLEIRVPFNTTAIVETKEETRILQPGVHILRV